VRDGIADDVSHVCIGELVSDLTTSPPRAHQAGAPEDAEVLADERLGNIEGVDELVDAVRVVREEVDHREPHGRGERAKESPGFLVRIERGVGNRQALVAIAMEPSDRLHHRPFHADMRLRQYLPHQVP